MNSLLSLFGVIGLIYLTDCVMWIKDHSFVFITWFGRNWRILDATEFKTSASRILLLNPLPPMGEIFCCRRPALALSPAGICSADDFKDSFSQNHEKKVLPVAYEEISSIEVEGREIRINAQRFCVCSDSGQAEKIAAFIRTVWKAKEKNRERLILEFWNESFNDHAAREKLAQVTRPMRSLRFLCNVLFFYLFVFSPVIVLFWRMPRLLIPLAVGMLALAVQIAYGYFKLHKKLYPEAKEDRITNFIKMTVCPPTALRAGDLITMDLLSDFHPLVVAQLLFAHDQYEAFGLQTLRNLSYPLKSEMNTRPDEISRWQNQVLLKMTSEYVEHSSKIMDKISMPPLADSPDNQAYCPRCLAQFVRSEGDCSDCPGIPLRPFSKMSANPDTRE